MKNRIFIVAAILGLLATACKKENPQNDLAVTPITISASYGVSDGAKVNYTESGDAITATWEAGDQLYVVYNGHLNTLTLSSGAGTTTATFTGTVIGTPTAMSVLICYVRDANNPLAVEVSATGEYTYTSGVFLAQDGTLASAAKCNLFYGTTTYGNGSNISCTFTPNTSMMKLTVFAPDGVSAGDAATLTYKSGSNELAKASFTVGANGRNTIYLTVPAGEYTGEQTLVYQSGEANVTETLSDTQAYFAAGQTYGRKVYFGSSVQEGALEGVFSVGTNKRVHFSQGNLRYSCSTSNPEWRFADNQYDYVAFDGSAYSENSGKWIDLFGYGTSGHDNGQTCWQPYSISLNSGDYYIGNLSGNADWGSNTISNGRNPVNPWYTLSINEWRHLFTGRANAASKWGLGAVNDIHGMVILPDTWTLPDGLSFTPGTGNWQNSYSDEQWNTMENAGAVFLPASGSRSVTALPTPAQSYGFYRSSTDAYYIMFKSDQLQTDGTFRVYGDAVRLVCNVAD